jgi:hypothetical protein
VAETCEPDQVRQITNAETTGGVTADVDPTAPIHAELAAKRLLPGTTCSAPATWTPACW